jgi:glycosyltransferase involved in cell wall biosynthesis
MTSSPVSPDNVLSTTCSDQGRDTPVLQDEVHGPMGALGGKRVGMVVFSSYPADPRPRRAAEALAENGMIVEVICQAEKALPESESVGVVSVRRIPVVHHRGGVLSYVYEYGAFILFSAALLAWRSLHKRYDLIYVHNMPDVLVFCALFPKLLGAKVILDQHDPMPELMETIFGISHSSLAVGVLRRLEKWSMAFADVVITVNTACKQIFAERSCGEEKIGVIMNTPDARLFPYRAASPCLSERMPGKPVVVMYHGSLVERNGVDLAIEAIARVAAAIPDIQLRIYGGWTPFLEKALAPIRENGLDKHVVYLGPRRLEELANEIALCDVGVIPNQRNAFTDINTPTRIFEYLALGKPVIAPQTRGIEGYFPPESIIFFEAGDADDLSRQILYAYFHPDEIAARTIRAQHIYLQHSWATERRRLVTLVEGLLRRPEAFARSGATL